jgi:hypothetical protein
MTQPSTFAAFKDLVELTGATDAELANMLSRGCADLPIANFEDALTEALLRFMRHLTGVPWVRPYQEGARPSEVTGAKDGQYGICWLLSVTPRGTPKTSFLESIDPNTNLARQDYCEVVSQMHRYSWQLDVYRDAGDPNRRQTTPTVQQPAGSAIDVLIRAGMKMQHIRARNALSESGIQYNSKPISGIRNIPNELVKNSFETRATANLEVFACPVSSIRAPTFGAVDFEFECPVFPDPPIPQEC